MREDLTDTAYDNRVNVQRVAVETVETDDILIIDARGDVRAASFGHILGTCIRARGAAGLVTDGSLRELFFTLKVADGAAITGVYPPDEQTMAEYASWRKAQ